MTNAFSLFIIHNFYVYIYMYIYINLLHLIVPLEAFYVAVGLQGGQKKMYKSHRSTKRQG